jgi:hypothetical protein
MTPDRIADYSLHRAPDKIAVGDAIDFGHPGRYAKGFERRVGKVFQRKQPAIGHGANRHRHRGLGPKLPAGCLSQAALAMV